jgi:hypothetical protein
MYIAEHVKTSMIGQITTGKPVLQLHHKIPRLSAIHPLDTPGHCLCPLVVTHNEQ